MEYALNHPPGVENSDPIQDHFFKKEACDNPTPKVSLHLHGDGHFLQNASRDVSQWTSGEFTRTKIQASG